MQKIVRLRLIRKYQRNRYPHEHAQRRSIFIHRPLRTIHQFDKYRSQDWAGYVRFLTKKNISKSSVKIKTKKKRRKKKKKNIDKTGAAWISMVLREKSSIGAEHLITAQIPPILGFGDAKDLRNRLPLRAGAGIKQLFKNQTTLYTSTARYLKRYGYTTLFKLFRKKKIKRAQRRAQKTFKKGKNNKAKESWLRKKFLTRQQRFMKAKRWREKKKKRSNPSFRKNVKGREIHTHLYHPRRWSSKKILVHPLRLRSYNPEVTYNNFFWRKYRWLSPKKFNGEFFTNYTKQHMKNLKIKKWFLRKNLSHNFTAIYNDFQFGVQAIKEGLVRPDHVPLNEEVKPERIWLKTKEYKKYIEEVERNADYVYRRRYKNGWDPKKKREYVKKVVNAHKKKIKEAYELQWAPAEQFFEKFRNQNAEYLFITKMAADEDRKNNRHIAPLDEIKKLFKKSSKKIKCRTYRSQMDYWENERLKEYCLLRYKSKEEAEKIFLELLDKHESIATESRSVERLLFYQKYILPNITKESMGSLESFNSLYRKSNKTIVIPQYIKKRAKRDKIGFEEFLKAIVKINISREQLWRLIQYQQIKPLNLKKKELCLKELHIALEKVA